jgi:hypothetical protein
MLMSKKRSQPRWSTFQISGDCAIPQKKVSTTVQVAGQGVENQRRETHKLIAGLVKTFLISRGIRCQDQIQHQQICLYPRSLRAMCKNCWLNWDRAFEHKCDFVREDPEQGTALPSGLRYNASVYLTSSVRIPQQNVVLTRHQCPLTLIIICKSTVVQSYRIMGANRDKNKNKMPSEQLLWGYGLQQGDWGTGSQF